MTVLHLLTSGGSAVLLGSGCDVTVDVNTGSDLPGCGGAAAPCSSIREGVKAAHLMKGEPTVCVKNGVYRKECAHGGIQISKTISITAAESTPPDVTIDCENPGPAFLFNPADLITGTLHLTGFAVENGLSQSSGAAIAAKGGALVVDSCYFKNCTSLANGNMGGHVFYPGGGGAIFVRNMRSVTLINSHFTSCAAPNGAGGAILVMLDEAAPQPQLQVQQESVLLPRHRQSRPKQHKQQQQTASASTTVVTTDTSRNRRALVRQFRVSSCNFDNSHAGFAGGAVAFVSNESITSDVDWQVESTSITNSEVHNSVGGSVFGGGVHVGLSGQAERVNATFQSCNITDSLLNCTGDGVCLTRGGGANIRFDKNATDIRTSFMGCVMSHHALYSASGGDDAQSTGGGVSFFFNDGTAVRVTSEFQDCNMSSNALTAFSNGGDANAFGGGVNVIFFADASDATTNFATCIMSGNILTASVAAGGGDASAYSGAVYVDYEADASGATTSLTTCTTSSNTLTASVADGGGDADAFGGAVYVICNDDASGATTSFTACIMSSNVVMASVAAGGGQADAYGGAVYVVYFDDVSGATTSLTTCTMSSNVVMASVAADGGVAQAFGGSVLVEYDDDASGATTSLTTCTMSHNTLTASVADGGGVASAYGGAVYVVYFADGSGATTTFAICTMSSNVMKASVAAGGGGGQVYGGAVYVVYFDDASGATTSFTACTTSSNVMAAFVADGDGDADAYGGAVEVEFYADASGATTSFAICTMSSNVVMASVAAGGGEAQALGGAVEVVYDAGASGATTSFATSTMSHNTLTASVADGGGNAVATGGAVYVEYYADASGATTSFISCRMHTNTGAKQGGGIYHQSQIGVSVSMFNMSIVGNVASEQGGGVWAEQYEANSPTNLGMVATYLGQGYTVPWECDPVTDGNSYRKWDMANATLSIEASDISSNVAGSTTNRNTSSTGTAADCTICFGGGIQTTNLQLLLHATNITGNHAAVSGGGLHFGPGSGSVVSTAAIVSNNTAGKSGGAISSASSGSIEITNGSVIDIGGGDVTAVTIREGGKLNLGGRGSLLRCSAGEELEYNFTSYPQAFDHWVVDCTHVIVDSTTHSSNFTNPSCSQIRKPKNDSQSVQTYACFNLPLHPSMLQSSGTVSCRPCANNLYSLQRGQRQDGKISAVTCHACSFGLDCHEGGAQLRALPGFWSHATATTVVASLKCPDNYCCARNSNGSCPWRSAAACQGHRDPTTPLCGGCLLGYSQSIDGSGCVSNSLCGKIGVWLLEQLVYYLVYALYALRQARHPLIPTWAQPKVNTGSVSIILFYYQLSAAIVPRGYTKLVSRASEKLGQLTSTQIMTSSGGVCVAVNMSGSTTIAWHLLAPALMILLLLVVLVILRYRSCPNRKQSSNSSSRAAAPGDGNDLGATLLLKATEGDAASSIGEDSARAGDAGSEVSSVSEVTVAARAVACLLLLSFSGLTISTLQLLNCVSVGGERVLFYSGDQQCNFSWQWPIWLLLLVIIALPAAPVLVWMLCQLPRSWRLARWAQSVSLQGYRIPKAVAGFACEPFSPRCWHWAAVLALQRFMTVMGMVFFAEGGTASVCVAIVSLCFLIFQLQARPYLNEAANTLQLVSCFSLVLLCVLSASSSFYNDVGFDTTGTPLAEQESTFDSAMLFLLFIPPLVYFASAIWSMVRRPSYDELIALGSPAAGLHLVDGEFQRLAAENRRLQQENSENVQLAAENRRLQQENDEKRQLAALAVAEKVAEIKLGVLAVAEKDAEIKRLQQLQAENDANIQHADKSSKK